MKALSCLIILVSSVLFCNAQAATGVYFVDVACEPVGVVCGNEDGSSWSDAYGTLGAAIDDLNDDGGGVVYVAAGTYSESALIFEAPIKLEGAGPDATTFEFTGSSGPAIKIKQNDAVVDVANSQYNASGSKISGIKIRPTVANKSNADIGGIFIVGASDILITRVWIANFGSDVGSFQNPYSAAANKNYCIKTVGDSTSPGFDPLNIKIIETYLFGCNNGIVALEGENNGSTLFIDQTAINDTKYGPALYVYSSGTAGNATSVNVSNSWFVGKDEDDTYDKSEYLIYLDGPTTAVKTHSMFANNSTEILSGEYADHVYVKTSANQFVSHTFTGGDEVSCDASGLISGTAVAPTAILFKNASTDNIVGQHISIGRGAGKPVICSANSTTQGYQEIWESGSY